VIASERVLAVGGELLEGPVWDADEQALRFVDIEYRQVHTASWPSLELESTPVAETVSAVIPRAGRECPLLMTRTGVAGLGDESPRVLVEIEGDRDWTRANDAACDPRGRLWVGTMADDERPGAGSLYRLDPDWKLTGVLTGVTISNGVGWSPGGERMYYIDSASRRLDVLDYDLDGGLASDRRPLVDTAELAGLPDGLAVDAEGGIWLAFFGGGCVRRLVPHGGAQPRRADVPRRWIRNALLPPIWRGGPSCRWCRALRIRHVQ